MSTSPKNTVTAMPALYVVDPAYPNHTERLAQWILKYAMEIVDICNDHLAQT